MESVPRAVATGSGPIAKIETVSICFQVATALGTDLIPKISTERLRSNSTPGY
jgi:hypothetical protein